VFEVDQVQKQPIVEVYINGCYCDVAKSIDLVSCYYIHTDVCSSLCVFLYFR